MSANNRESFLFVYGSLMRDTERKRLLGRSVGAIPARLDGYRRGQSKYYFVARDSDAETEGAILLDLTERDFQILDEYEDTPRIYTRERISVIGSDGQSIECWIYLPTGWEEQA